MVVQPATVLSIVSSSMSLPKQRAARLARAALFLQLPADSGGFVVHAFQRHLVQLLVGRFLLIEVLLQDRSAVAAA